VNEVTTLVRAVGGVSSAAHLKDRGVRAVLEELKTGGVDGVEVLHPSHDAATERRLRKLAVELDLAPTGGTDWHGDFGVDRPIMTLGSLEIPSQWLERVEQIHAGRVGAEVTGE